MTTYERLAEQFASARNKESGKPIANNTRIVKRGENYAIRLHSTDILTFRPDGSIEYNTGGWKTVTTKERMNRYGPAPIWSKRGAWYISGEVYSDGCCMKPDGTLEGTAPPSQIEQEKIQRKQAAKYAKDYTEALYAGDIPAPSGGDCWGCLMKGTDGTRPLGGASHILDHFAESYFVPSLIWAAFDAFGASQVMKWEAAGLQNLPGKPDGWKPFEGYVRQQIQRTIRRHCLRELGLSA